LMMMTTRMLKSNSWLQRGFYAIMELKADEGAARQYNGVTPVSLTYST
jgi:hypothetical protein